MPQETTVDLKKLLTEREIEVVQCIMEACSNKDIAKQFKVSEETVKRHLSNIFDKVGCSTRLELALMYAHNTTVDHRFMRAYECGVCRKDFVIRDASQEPQKYAVSVGGVSVADGLACPSCAGDVEQACTKKAA